MCAETDSLPATAFGLASDAEDSAKETKRLVSGNRETSGRKPDRPGRCRCDRRSSALRVAVGVLVWVVLAAVAYLFWGGSSSLFTWDSVSPSSVERLESVGDDAGENGEAANLDAGSSLLSDSARASPPPPLLTSENADPDPPDEEDTLPDRETDLLLAGYAPATPPALDGRAVSYPELESDYTYKLQPNGIICEYKPYGQLNNNIISIKGGVVLAYVLQRTYVIPEYLSSLIDAHRLARAFPGYLVPFSQKLCTKRYNVQKIRVACYHHLGCNLFDEKVRNDLRRYAGHVREVGIKGFALFRSALYTRAAGMMGFPPIEANFYRNLYPTPVIRQRVNEFVENAFANQEFGAVHLRNLEGSCVRRMREQNAGVGLMLCNLHKKRFHEVLADVTGLASLPVFVASDGEDKDALRSYDHAARYTGPCNGLECALIDFEIAARSNFFVGVVVSTAAHTIANLRLYRRDRDVGRQFPSILSWSRNETLKGYNGGHYLRRSNGLVFRPVIPP